MEEFLSSSVIFACAYVLYLFFTRNGSGTSEVVKGEARGGSRLPEDGSLNRPTRQNNVD